MTTVPDRIDRRFREAAATAGLLDVAYDYTDSPVGKLLVATSERGLTKRTPAQTPSALAGPVPR